MKGKPAVAVKTPSFRSESEEARWWAANQDRVEDLLIRYGRRAVVPLKSVTIRLPEPDIERARRLARKSGVGYQTLIKTLLHNALHQAEKNAS